MPPKGKYTDPKLRDQVKEDVQASDKGGKPGQWSARKAQFMASEYKKQGGGYTTDKETGQDESQKNLSKWGDEDWQTKDGSGTAKHDDGTRDRYLPKKAWDKMNDEEKEATDDKKHEASAKGQQHVANTGKAKQARSDANKDAVEDDQAKKAEKGKKDDSKSSKQSKAKDGNQSNGTAPRRSGRGTKQEADDEKKPAAKTDAEDKKKKPAAAKKAENKKKPAAKKDAEAEEDQEMKDADDEEFEDPGADDDVAAEHPDAKDEDPDSKDSTMDTPQVESAKAGQKRGRQTKKGDDESSKKQKGDNGASKGKGKGTFGSKGDSTEEPAPAASADRLPKKGQRVSWKSLPGWVHGETVEILTKEKTVDGKKVKASEKDPRIVMKSDNGKIAVHKPAAVHFEG